MMFVARIGLSFSDVLSIKLEVQREGPPHVTELFQSAVFGSVAGYLDISFRCDGQLDFVTCSQVQSFHEHGGRTHGQTIAPF